MMNLDIVPMQSDKRRLIEDELLIRFSLFDVDREQPVPEIGSLRFLVFEPSEGWQEQGWAHPVAENVYEMAFPAPGPGRCYVFFASPKTGVGYADLPHLILQTTEAGIIVHRQAADATPADRPC